MDGAKLIATRRVEYSGKEAGAPTQLSWARMAPALPSAEACGRVPATSLAHPGVKRLLENPEMTLRPKCEWGPQGLRAPCHHVAADSEAIVRGLTDIGCSRRLPWPRRRPAKPDPSCRGGSVWEKGSTCQEAKVILIRRYCASS